MSPIWKMKKPKELGPTDVLGWTRMQKPKNVSFLSKRSVWRNDKYVLFEVTVCAIFFIISLSLWMALSFRFWRLNLLPKPSLSQLQTTLKALKPLKQKLSPICSLPMSSSSLNPLNSHLSISKNPTFSESHSPIACPQDDLVVLGIETSCDDTAAAVVWYWFASLDAFCTGHLSILCFSGLSVFFLLGFLSTGKRQWWNPQPSCVFSGMYILFLGFSFGSKPGEC